MKRNYFIVVLQYIGLLLLITGVFLGVNFLTMGLLYISIPVALFVGVFAQIIAMNLVKQKRNPRDMYTAGRMRGILLGVYFLIVLISLPFFLHFLTISVKNQTVIQSYYEEEMAVVEQNITRYKKEILSFKSIIATKLENEDSSKNTGAIDSETNSIVKPLVSAYNEVKQANSDYSNRFQQVLSSWNLFVIGAYVQNWELNKASWNDKLIKVYNAVNAENGNVKQDFEIVEDLQKQNIASYFTSINFENAAWLITILALLIVHFLVLLEYITIKSKETGKIVKSDLDGGTSAY